MTVTEQFFEYTKLLPQPLAQEALDFVLFLRARVAWRMTRFAMAAVWDNPQDEAWNDVEGGDLVLVPFPFSDLPSQKRRSALMLTALNEHDDLLACPVTSWAGWRYARPLPPDHLAEGALPVVSWLRTDKVVTVHAGLVARGLAASLRLSDVGG